MMAEKALSALEAIQKIKETEARAKAILEKIHSQEIPEILAKAHEEARIIVEEILAKAKEEAERRKEAILAQARKEVEKIKKETEEEIERIEKTARERFDLAWQAIYRQILKEIEDGRI